MACRLSLLIYETKAGLHWLESAVNMETDHLTSFQLLEHLKKDPSNFDILSQVAKRSADPKHEVAIRNGMLVLFGATPELVNTWRNCIDQQTCHPKSMQRPKALKDLIGAVQAGKSEKLHVRAVGSGHSFSNVCPTDGILLNPRDPVDPNSSNQMNSVLPIDASVLRDPSLKSTLFSAESGMTIEELNQHLDANHLALENMGAYDGQTLAGAISTGTHGTGISFGPIASSVRSLTLVSSSGTVYQIEPKDGITDPAKFSSKDVVLKQDDAWFYTTLVAMGCTGLIYSYTFHVVPAFYIKELRTLHFWEDLKAGLKDGASSQVLTSHRGYELNINPYSANGKHACIQVIHDDTSDTHTSGDRGFKNWLGGLLASIPVVEKILVVFLNLFPKEIPSTISTALDALISPNGIAYVDKSYKVMNIGTVVNKIKAYALELSLPCDTNLVDNVDKLLDFLDARAQAGKGYLTGPVNLRFVAASKAFLAPQTGRPTCMIELDMLVGIDKADDLFKDVKTAMCTKGSGIRVHWGLDPEDSISNTDVQDWYPDLQSWLMVYKELNADGMWNSPLTDRLGISV
ncbi:hypothetical protein BKA66DRAFT_555073 [Pyrenochaeta sp. MPI-SDFR-AT-0127]|nr:hypothetical protein BKA66DRAFT_555073 [Pyrenochaeta sp. MPI-SDFR-AT-0127]